MDTRDKDKFGLEKSSDPVNYHSSNMSSDWRFGGANLTNQSMSLVPADNSIPVCKGNLMGSSVPMVNSFCPTIWDHSNSQSLGFCDNNVQTTSNTVAIRKGLPGCSSTVSDKVLDLGWNSKGGVFLQGNPGILPQSLSQFPADSDFIERAARFSCLNFNDLVNPLNMPQSLSPYSKGGMVHGPLEELSAGRLHPALGALSQNNEPHLPEVAKEISPSAKLGATEGSSMKNERQTGNFVRPPHEAKQGIGVSSHDSEEAEFSSGGGGGRDDPSMLESAGGEPSSSKGIGKKRKRSGQDNELDQVKGAQQLPGEAAKDNTETNQKVEQNPISTNAKPTGKHSKDNSQASDAPKEDYIHVRARRGQATNSHSLAERVRREKISERMKFLQDLVPGCSKVTGKALMLDEIINYVQSLQRQVEFLSMKLAAVNPRLDFNIEGLLAKDGLVQAGIPSMANPPDALRRTINSQLTAMNGGYKETTQLPNLWVDDELHNVVQMSLGSSVPFNSQELNGSLPPGHMKVEL
ncbi:PREDICTED: transcription factor bHLH49 isoform X2 [Nelumbo nucifera]|uniref:BHLH domain-containing protein n=2 Tax=Nelumbo nucifera TaxID=4432 RepID=A0A822YBS7_NELNU|nr:PREDICTED: transcription factor bHLH49 isoform X2 [Nelumbo nucifera]DAD31574.1 TPA_asm: hypothetical protein HUJ06_010425 [Nelumbo nucifera]